MSDIEENYEELLKAKEVEKKAKLAIMQLLRLNGISTFLPEDILDEAWEERVKGEG